VKRNPKSAVRKPNRDRAPVLVAIVGGSGAGKSWLAERLETALAGQATRLALDDFYRDRSYLSLAQRTRINYDHPRAIDWAGFERVLRCLRAGRTPCVPRYDFATHSRLKERRRLQPKPIVLVEGLWLLRRPALRRSFTLRLFLQCATRTRLQRRLARDKQSRGRTEGSVRAQFRDMVEPMHRKFVEPQARWADVVLPEECGAQQVEQIAAALRATA
jgi:uridine kinase